jgi:hypothetical protein
MRGRAKGETERIVILAHQTEAMARQKRLHQPDYYLRHSRRPKPGPPAVVAAFKRWEKMGLVKSSPHVSKEGSV